jgi:exonuclease SbcC
MIPHHLKLSGFLSYRDPVEVDFTSFELACISGHNGAGKSSLLDAITWVLFGQARKRDETLINSASETAEVMYTFGYEGNVFRIRRILTRGKSTMLEFQVLDGEQWRVLTEATVRQTQARIETILRLDYDTFVNASFFLQGKADQFTQQKASERKHILSNILGLELWESYRERAADHRKSIERSIDSVEGRISEINFELEEEPARRARLKDLEDELLRLQDTRKAQEALMTAIKLANDTVKRQQEQVEQLKIQKAQGASELNVLLARQAARETEQSRFALVVANAAVVQAAYQGWQDARAQLGEWEKLAEQFRDQEKVRQEPLARIGAEQARLEQEQDSLAHRQAGIEAGQTQLTRLEAERTKVQKKLSDLEARLKVRSQLEQSQAIIATFREQARRRQVPLTEINSEKARLEQELKTLEKQRESIETQAGALAKLRVELGEEQILLSQAEERMNLRKTLEQDAQVKKEGQILFKSSNERLKLEMESLDERIKKLQSAEGALCPLCGQPLSPDDRQNLIENLRKEGREKGNEFRKNKIEIESLAREIAGSEKEISAFGRIEKDHLFRVANVSMKSERIEANSQAIAEWGNNGAPRLLEIQKFIQTEDYSPQARGQLGRIDRELQAIGRALGVKAPDEGAIFEAVEGKVLEIENEIQSLKGLEEERIEHTTRAAQLKEQINLLRSDFEEWSAGGKPRLNEISEILRSGNFSLAERSKLAEIEQQLKALGYDAQAHDAVRRAEQAGRASENELRELESARAALIPLEREMFELQQQVNTLRTRLETLTSELATAQKSLEDQRASTPNLHEAEKAHLDALERVNILTREVGAAHQKVRVLQELRMRKSNYEMEREELAGQVKNHKTLERAFGKDGVPALLIEQALPQIEDKANELLDRLSNGSMSVRFVTQAEFKDKKREDRKETLDILINDGAGTRDYEMFSGGEAFRVNFAIRLALSEVLARRTGARLQTLVIDEGFGSQDTEGRQRLVEAINQVKADFAKILIITHLDELKDAFPNRIEVEKTARGSRVSVL